MATTSTRQVLQTSQVWRARRQRQHSLVHGKTFQSGASLLHVKGVTLEQLQSTLTSSTTSDARSCRGTCFRRDILNRWLLPGAQLHESIPPLPIRGLLQGGLSTQEENGTREGTDESTSFRADVIGLKEILLGQEYRASSYMAMHLAGFFRKQVHPGEILRTENSLDLLFTLGMVTEGLRFTTGDTAQDKLNGCAWRHAIYAGIIPSTFENAYRVQGHLCGIFLYMLAKFVLPSPTGQPCAWPRSTMEKAIGCLLFFLKAHDTPSTPTGQTYDIDLLRGVDSDSLLMFLEWSASEMSKNSNPNTLSVERELCLLWANRLELGGEGAVIPNAERVVSLLSLLTDPASRGVLFYYLLLGIDRSLPRGFAESIARRGAVVAFFDSLVLKDPTKWNEWQTKEAGVATSESPFDDVLVPTVCRTRKVSVDKAQEWLRVCRRLGTFLVSSDLADNVLPVEGAALAEVYQYCHCMMLAGTSVETETLISLSTALGRGVSSPNKLVGPAESAVPHMLVRAAFGRRALEQLRVESRHLYLQFLNVALEKARELDHDVIDTAVELLLQQAEQ